jgi:hypothetical protein
VYSPSSASIAAILLLSACGGQTSRKQGGPGLACPPCPSSAVCVDDPRDSCHPDGGTACAGVCASQRCGGIAGTPCPQGSTCVDDPRDDCDPSRPGDSDCAGLCAP